MRSRPKATYLDLANEMGVVTCQAGPSGCRKKWPPALHDRGTVDQMGVLHWTFITRRVRRRRRLWLFMLWMAYAKNRAFRTGTWEGMWQAVGWARNEAATRFHVRFTYEETLATREELRRRARREGATLRRTNNDVFLWVNYKPRKETNE